MSSACMSGCILVYILIKRREWKESKKEQDQWVCYLMHLFKISHLLEIENLTLGININVKSREALQMPNPTYVFFFYVFL